MQSAAWLELCRAIVSRQRQLFAANTGIAHRTSYEGRGEGGDMALELDRRSEDIVFEELERLVAGGGPSLEVTSEERGVAQLGGGEASLRVIVDPIDGSLNVRRTIPSHSLSIAVAAGDTMADVEVGFVHDFGAGEEFAATRGGGVTLNGEPIEADPPDHGLEVVGIESAEPSWIEPSIAALRGKAYRLRVVGSIAITMSYVGLARFDAMFSGRPCRSVDAAASQLVVVEAGGAVSFNAGGPEAAPLDLDARYTVAATRRPEYLEEVVAAQAEGPAVSR